MADIPLAEVIRELRAELESAMSAGEGQRVQFEATAIELELQIGVTKTDQGNVGVRFWVLDLGGGKSRARESIQRVTLSLQPVLASGKRVKIAKPTSHDPLGGQGG
jgi:hypothetical protein